MQIGSDFFKWFKFIIQLVQVFAKIFGDADDQVELEKNGFTDQPTTATKK